MKRILARALAVVRRRNAGWWALEIAGVALLAAAAYMWIAPLGLVAVGVYLIITANTGGD